MNVKQIEIVSDTEYNVYFLDGEEIIVCQIYDNDDFQRFSFSEITKILKDNPDLSKQYIDKHSFIKRLAEIDAETIRPLRATLAGTQTEADAAKLMELETEATELRKQLNQ